jgi:pimeloyl-ACP methyl ester carboxylesterase
VSLKRKTTNKDQVTTSALSDAVQQMDDRMKECILRLHRSALTVGAEWQSDLKDTSCPNLVLWGVKDHACPVSFADFLAADLGASRVLKLDTGHWFELETRLRTRPLTA